MGIDDDAGCVEHVWVLEEIGLRLSKLDLSSTCARCGAVRYEPAPDPRDRPPL